ncbi:MAG: cupin domain-containing protein [Hyphomicrobiaceae bacterium]|nr:MAG: cupin domain-containing protein [Hyphomicrobiaceae bacterium]
MRPHGVLANVPTCSASGDLWPQASHPNEQWIYVLQGTLRATIGGKDYEAKPGILLYVPSNVVHSVKATRDLDGVFLTAKDASHGLQGVKAG